MKGIKKFSQKELQKAGVPKDIQWVITNKCDLAFTDGHCAVPNTDQMPELLNGGISDIFRIIDALAIMDFEVKILGGNPSDNRSAFLSVIDRMNKRDITYAITDNAMNEKTILEAVKQHSVKGFVFSIDTLKSLPQYRSLQEIDIGGCSPLKSAAALKLIPKIRSKVPYVAVNTMIHAGNIKQIIPIVKHCTDELNGVIVNLCPIIHGSLLNDLGENLYIFRGQTDSFSLQLKHKPAFVKLMDELIELKKSGYLIGVPVEYLELLKSNVCGEFTWNCGELERCPIFRLFPNGMLGVCSDLVGRDMQYKGLTLFDLLSTDRHILNEMDKNKLGFTPKLTIEDLIRNSGKINEAWLNDRDRNLCCKKGGCAWSNIIIASIYQKKGYGTLTATTKNL
ncbi:MAG: hypothetical protein U9P70_04890 [Patescibacteria group bacterium]|nr:hypothetical protein [Patescibacteria group bacterium]